MVVIIRILLFVLKHIISVLREYIVRVMSTTEVFKPGMYLNHIEGTVLKTQVK